MGKKYLMYDEDSGEYKENVKLLNKNLAKKLKPNRGGFIS